LVFLLLPLVELPIRFRKLYSHITIDGFVYHYFNNTITKAKGKGITVYHAQIHILHMVLLQQL
jgi:hypothetical protein